MQPIQTLQVLLKNTNLSFQICRNKQCLTLKRPKSNKRNPSAKKLPSWKLKNAVVLKSFPKKLWKKNILPIKFLWIKGASISYNVIKGIAKAIVVANDRTMLVEHGGYLTFPVNWAQNVLNKITQSERKMVLRMATTSKVPITLAQNVLNKITRSERKMVQRMATTSKVPITPGLVREEQLTFQQKIQALIKWHNIQKDLVLKVPSPFP